MDTVGRPESRKLRMRTDGLNQSSRLFSAVSCFLPSCTPCVLEHGFKSREVKTILCCVFGRGKSGNHSLGFGLCTRRGDRDFLSGLLLQRFESLDCSANSSHSAWVAGDPCEENLSGDERTGARVI